MTEPTDNPWRGVYVGGPPGEGIAVPAFIAGQLDLHGIPVEEAGDYAAAVEDRLAAITAERERLDLAVAQHRAEALADVTRHTAAAAAAGTALDRAVAEARGMGATWQQIADAAGITRQSAWTRWADR